MHLTRNRPNKNIVDLTVDTVCRVMRRPVFLLALVCLGSTQLACSQEPAISIPPVVVSVNDSLTFGRQNAITRAITAVTPAIVSINVIELQRVVYRDPLASFFNNPLFAPYIGDREELRQVQNLGSGFLVSTDGYIVTNDHVAGDASRITVSLYDGRTLEAELIGRDKFSDLALLKVDSPDPLPFLAFADEPRPIVGEWAIALGNPFGLFAASEPTVTVGVVSGVGRNLGKVDDHYYYGMIQTDAAINIGNSGGPLVNALGEVIGVNTTIYTRDNEGGSVGLGFAVPSSKALRIVEELRNHETVLRYDGLQVQEFSYRTQQGSQRSIIVTGVVPGSPGEQAGIQVEDVLIAVNGTAISGFADYVGQVSNFLPEDTVTYGVIRGEEAMEIDVLLGREEPGS